MTSLSGRRFQDLSISWTCLKDLEGFRALGVRDEVEGEPTIRVDVVLNHNDYVREINKKSMYFTIIKDIIYQHAVFLYISYSRQTCH